MKACTFYRTLRRTSANSDSDIISLAIRFFFLDFFASRFPHLVDSFPVVWHLRHRFHLYNVGDDLLYHSNSLRRREFSFDSSGSHLTGKVDVSRLGSCIECVHLRDSDASQHFLSVFNLPFPSTAREEISQECARRRAFENRKASTTSRRFC